MPEERERACCEKRVRERRMTGQSRVAQLPCPHRRHGPPVGLPTTSAKPTLQHWHQKIFGDK